MEQLPRCNRGIDSEVEDEARASACEARDSIATFANFLEQQQRLLVHWLRVRRVPVRQLSVYRVPVHRLHVPPLHRFLRRVLTVVRRTGTSP